MKKILVTGGNGQLGSELQQLAPLYAGFEFLFTDYAELPIDDEKAVFAYFREHNPSFCINCAAYTAVDKAESDQDKAMLVNGTSVGYLAKAATDSGARFIHISTDYVFDGEATEPIEEDAPVNPLGVYGLTKLRGEQLALEYAPDAIIIRTAWVYSAYGHNFVKTMLRLMSERKELNVVSDQVGSPTYAADLAKAILDIIVVLSQQPTLDQFRGIYHYSNDGVISWYDFAVAIRDLSGSKCDIHPIPAAAYPTPARRPAYSVLSKDKIRTVFGIRTIPWQDSLKACLLQLQQLLA